MTAVQTHLYRYSFWLAPLVAWPFWYGVMRALENPVDAWWTWWAVIAIQGIVPLLDVPLGRVVTRFNREQHAALSRDLMLRAVPWVCGCVWLTTLAWALSMVPQVLQLPAIHVAGFVVSLGVVGGIMAINVGHEQIGRAHV